MLYHRDKRTLMYGMRDSKLHIYPLRVTHYDNNMEQDPELTKTYRPAMYHNQFPDGTFVMAYDNNDPGCVWYGMTIVEEIEESTYTRAMYNHCSDELAYQVWKNTFNGPIQHEHEVIDAETYEIPMETETLVELLENVLENGIDVVNEDNISIDESQQADSEDENDSVSSGLTLQTASDIR